MWLRERRGEDAGRMEVVIMTILEERQKPVETIEPQRPLRRKVYGWLTAVAVVCAVPVGLIISSGGGELESVAYLGMGTTEYASISGYAASEGLSGLSPASLIRVENVLRAGVDPSTNAWQLALLSRYAQSHNVTGLSPASLASAPIDSSTALAGWAQAGGLSGLSPASLGPTGRSDMAAIGVWAHKEGLSGLSPASLRPIGD